MMSVDVLLSMALPPGFDVTAIDRDKPFGFAVGPLSMETEPQVFVLIPTQNPDAIKTLLPTEGEFYSTRVSGGYLGITRGLVYPDSTGKCELLDGVPEGIVGLSVDVAAILDSFGPMIEFGMQMARMGISDAVTNTPEAADGMDIAAIMDLYFEGAQNVLDSIEGFKLSVDVDETLVDVRWQMLVSEGSPMASLADEGPTRAAEFMPLLTEDSIAFIFGADTEALMDKTMPFFESLFSAYPEGMAEGMTQSLDSWKDAYGMFGNALAGSGSFGEDGMRIATYFDGAQFDQLLAKYESITREPFWASMGMQYVDTKKAQLGETTLTRFTFDFDIASILAETDPDVGAEQIAQMEAMMESLYGSQMVITLAKAGDLGVMTVGGDDDYLRAALDRAGKPNPLTPDMQRLTEMAATSSPFMAYRFDVGQMMTEVIPVLEGSFGTPPSGLEMFAGTSLPLNIYFAITPSTWTGGMMVDLVQAGEFARMMETIEER